MLGFKGLSRRRREICRASRRCARAEAILAVAAAFPPAPPECGPGIFAVRQAGFLSLSLSLLGWIAAGGLLAYGLCRRRQRKDADRRTRQLDQTLDKVADIVLRYRPLAGCFDYVSSSIERITGFTRKEFLAMPPVAVLQRISVEDQLQFLAGLAETLRSDDVDGKSVEYRWCAKDGSRIWARTAMRVTRTADGDVDAIVATTQISTLQKRVEEHARARTQRIISALPGAIFRLVLSPDGTYHLPYASDGGIRVFGMPAENLINNLDLFKTLSPREDRVRLSEAVRRSAEKMTPLEEGIRVTPPEGPARWAIVRSEPRSRTDGSVLWDGMLLDVSELKRSEEEKSALQAQLFHSQRLEAMGRLAGGVAHDFNNLLTVILGYSEFLLESLEENSSRRREVEQIRKAGDKASALTQQLLAFSRRQVVKPALLNLNESISDLSKMLRRVIGEDVDLQIHLAGTACWVKADRVQVDQMIMNLVVNARDAMPQGGRLTIETGTVTLDGPAIFEDFEIPGGVYVVVSISDTGCGMDEETRRHVFDPFFTTKEVGKGTGLGMSTVYGAVKQSGGHIVIFSEPGKGTTLKIYLPLASGQAAAQTDTPHRLPKEAYPGAEAILVVEDDSAVRSVAKRVLVENGYTVFDADCGEAALRICAREDLVIDLLLTDTIMPGMNGPELAKRVRELRPGLKTVFMSGYTDTVLIKSGVVDDSTVLIPKPFSAASLTRSIRRALDG